MKPTFAKLLVLASSLCLAAPADPARGARADGRAAGTNDGASEMPTKQRITTCLWFRDQAEEAMRFYASLFEGSRITDELRWGPGGPMPAGSLITANVELAGQRIMVLNGNFQSQFNDSASLVVDCDTQEEIDRLWEKLLEGGAPTQCGWLRDRFGVSWQIVPSMLPKMLVDEDPARAQRVMQAMLGMRKLDIAALQKAYDGR